MPCLEWLVNDGLGQVSLSILQMFANIELSANNVFLRRINSLDLTCHYQSQYPSMHNQPQQTGMYSLQPPDNLHQLHPPLFHRLFPSFSRRPALRA